MGDLERVLVEAPAKVNLLLEITGRREDGYHLLETVMHAVSLSDLVLLGQRRDPGIRITCSRPGVPEDEGNLAYKAAMAFFAAAGIDPENQGLHIHIDKKIPHQAGLGGGSADAAGVLVGLDRLYGTAIGPRRLEKLGLGLGADVPFAIRGGCALCKGVGEEMRPLAPAPAQWGVLLAKPEAGMSTSEAYGFYDEIGHTFSPRGSGALLAAMESKDCNAVGSALLNIFEQVNPFGKTMTIRLAMEAAGAAGVVLSGSGSAVMGLYPAAHSAAEAAQSLEGIAQEVFAARFVEHGAQIIWQG